MPSETVSGQQNRSSASAQRRSSNTDRTNGEHPSTSPNPNGNVKTKKHVVHAARNHSRIPSNKGIHKLHDPDSGARKPLRNSSTTSLKKNNSHVNLKRNRSAAEVKFKSMVTFEIGEQEEGWEETSSSTSPAVSRTQSRSTSKPQTPASTSKSHPQSPKDTLNKTSPDKHNMRVTGVDPKAITERLLSRTQSHQTTQTSLATAIISPNNLSVKDPKFEFLNTDEASHPVTSTGTPSDASHFTHHSVAAPQHSDDFKRAQSMGNIPQLESEEQEEASALAPRLRHPGAGAGQSRTQKKLWLQRASSNIEQKQITSQLGELSSLVGAVYEGRDPRIKSQLERTGLEYLVVQRYQDPVGTAMKRIKQIPGMERNYYVSRNHKKSVDSSISGSVGDRYSLSQDLCSHMEPKDNSSSASVLRSHIFLSGHGVTDCFAGHADTPQKRLSAAVECDNVMVLLRKLWDKSSELSISGD